MQILVGFNANELEDYYKSKMKLSIISLSYIPTITNNRVLFPLGVTFYSKFYNPNLHNIAGSNRIGFKTKNPYVINTMICAMKCFQPL